MIETSGEAEIIMIVELATQKDEQKILEYDKHISQKQLSKADEDRESIRSGKLAPRTIFTKQIREKTKRGTPYDKIMSEIQFMYDSIQLIKKSITRLKDIDEYDEIRDLLVDMILNLRMLPVNDDYHKFVQIRDEYSSVIPSLTESIPTLLNDYVLNECKGFIEEDIGNLKKLLSVIESELKKGKNGGRLSVRVIGNNIHKGDVTNERTIQRASGTYGARVWQYAGRPRFVKEPFQRNNRGDARSGNGRASWVRQTQPVR